MSRAVILDVGETVLDRSREYAAWAAAFGVPPHTFSAVFGAIVARGGSVADVIAHFRPGAGYSETRAALDRAGALPPAIEADVYPGVRTALACLRADGWFVGIAGNQEAGVGAEVRALELPVDLVVVSGELGARKPEPAFFAAIAERAGIAADEIVYVGDQLGNDVAAALAAGMRCVRVLTGPWGQLTRDPALESRCVGVLESAAGLPNLLGRAQRE